MMCTSINYQTIDGYNFLARTLDYDDSISEEILVIPRCYQWNRSENRQSKYAALGLGLEAQGAPMLYDGVNEKGLMCAILYFDQACYNPCIPGKDNLKSYDFALWRYPNTAVLTKCLRIWIPSISHWDL